MARGRAPETGEGHVVPLRVGCATSPIKIYVGEGREPS